MAHVGKLFPRGVLRELFGFRYPDSFLPRKWTVVVTATTGPIAAQWTGLTVVSDVGTESADRQTILYRFQHPTITDSWIDLSWSLVLHLGASSLSFYDHRLQWDLYNLSVLRATNAFTWNPPTRPWELISIPPFLGHTGFAPSKWIPPGPGQDIQWGWRWATWEEQPEYTPYDYATP